MELSSWQEHLEQHFASLKAERAEVGLPVFALEHGLGENEVQLIEKEIRIWIKTSLPSHKHWIPWVIYASEIGYRYAGNEYWQTFESETPGWTENGDREVIRRWFKKFHFEFNGAIPSGVWANHFSIIAWPITHAILPRDLQLQLAKILYELRYHLTRRTITDTNRFGQLIESQSWYSTSRFRNFCQQHSLVGQIAAALIYGQTDSENLIHPETLKKIISDLDRTRNGRLWLKEAQNASQRVQIRGLSRPGIRRDSSDQPEQKTQDQATFLGIEPQLFLCPGKKEDWDTFLEIPNFTPLLNEFPQYREYFRESRCIVECSSEGWKGKSWLLFGPYSLKIKIWPHPSTPLIRLEKSNEDLDFLLRTECLLRPTSTWLFHISENRIGKEIKGKIVRPGQRYVVVSTDSRFPNIKNLKNCSISCAGVVAAFLNLPTNISTEEIEGLERFGLSVQRDLKVWPAGIPARRWDGEGHSEWLTTERPILAICCNQPIDRLTVSLNGEGEEEFSPATQEEPLFIQLPFLSEGFHKLQVFTELESAGTSTSRRLDGNLELIVRKPKPCIPGSTLHSGLVVLKDPNEPTLEELWQNKVSINILGPSSRTMRCGITLFGDKGEPLHKETLPEINLPINPNEWLNYFGRLCNNPKLTDKYELSSTCLVEILGGELGTFKFLAERGFTPLRWVPQRNGKKYKAHLIDDTGTDKNTLVEFYDFFSPDENTPISDEQLIGIEKSMINEGLYAATNGVTSCNLIFLPSRTIRLEEWEFLPKLKEYSRTLMNLVKLIHLTELWGNAQIVGQVLAIVRQRKVMEYFHKELALLICGKKWIEAENHFLNNPKDQYSLDQLGEAMKSNNRNFHILLKRKFNELIDIPPNERALWLAEKSKRFGVATKSKNFRTHEYQELCKFSLRLATSPQTIRYWADKNFDKYLEEILDRPIIMRAARMLGLLIAEKHEFKGSNWLPLSRGWSW